MIWIINGKRFKENFPILKFRIDEEYFRFHSPLSKTYGKVDNNWKSEFNFSWSWCRKSWSEVQRHVFIDFGDEHLFWVKNGMGTSYGKGKKITKEKFINKYGGDLELLATLVDDSSKKIE